MLQPISQKRIILCGTNGTGKSTFAEKCVDAILRSAPNKTALAVLADNGEKIFYPYQEISRAQLNSGLLTSKKNKIFFDKKKINGLDIYDDIQQNYKNGVLLLDDARAYVRDSADELRSLYIRSRQGNFHIMFLCHGLSEIPPNLFTWSTEMVLFNTTDSWERLKNKIPNPTKFKAIVEEVREITNTHVNGCNPRAKCTCGNGYKYKTIDLKRDLI